MAVDPTVVAVPAYAATILAERHWLRRRARREGPSAADYDTPDMVTSLTMGVLSLVAPLVVPKVMRPLVPGVGRFGRVAVGTAVGLGVVAAVADRLSRPRQVGAPGQPAASGQRVGAKGTADEPDHVPAGRGHRWRHRVRRRMAKVADPMAKVADPVATVADPVATVAGVGAVVAAGLTAAASWAWLTDPQRLWRHRLVRDLGDGPAAFAAAMVGWDFIYYWNHRLMHECRAMWAIHVVHHSSERYNLSTALRQPVADAVGIFVPYGAMSLLGIRPSLVASARAWNLLYQYWIHTDVVRSLGPGEEVLNTPSLHRVHHGSNHRYLDRNHGGILIVWDRLFGTHQVEDPAEPVVYGLTTNIGTFNPLRVATHEHRDMLTDVARSRSWRHRVGYVLRHPGWEPAA